MSSKLVRIVHPHASTPVPGNVPVIDPIYPSIKYTFQRYADLKKFARGNLADGILYARGTNPTTRSLERTVAELQGREENL